jgi:thioredoxin-like negative regulator of GroEL
MLGRDGSRSSGMRRDVSNRNKGIGMPATGAEKAVGRAKSRLRSGVPLVLALLCAGVMAWAGWAWWSHRRYRSSMDEINAEVAAGRLGMAGRKLEKLLAWKPDSDEAAYLLGICERGRGRMREAAAAWARVAPGSAYSERAILARMSLFLDSGQLAAAEQFINDTADDPRNLGSAVRVLLAPIYSQLGRIEEAERLIEARWEHLNETGEGTPDKAIVLVRLLIEIKWKGTPVETIRGYLDQTGRAAPQDDRVWLGRANLAIRTGAYDEAERWLNACLRARPEDVAVWRARLRWGMATNKIDVVQQALTHLPAAESALAEIHRLKAWLSAQRGDIEAERRELERVVAADPADIAALDRLGQLADQAGQRDRIATVVAKKADIERMRDRYIKLYERNQPVRDAVEMAHLAEQLGSAFEARVFLTVAIGEDPDREDLRQDLQRVAKIPKMVAKPGETLAGFLALDQFSHP